ncbi:MAG: hypothetical protein ACKVQW_05075 [Pyrinomonadaceae bacterium]
MFFRPKFCANCGEKIERVDWGLLTSRRFCQVCESEFKGVDLIPRAIAAVGVLATIFGFGSYLKSGSETGDRVAKLQPHVSAAATAPTAVASNSTEAASPTSQPKATAAVPFVAQPPKTKPETHESQYFCGAETKKGTPCSRRVKGNVRCYQHVGMPAMLAAEKLKVD